MGPTIEQRKDLDGMLLLLLSSLVGKTSALSSKYNLTKVPRRSPQLLSARGVAEKPRWITPYPGVPDLFIHDIDISLNREHRREELDLIVSWYEKRVTVTKDMLEATEDEPSVSSVGK